MRRKLFACILTIAVLLSLTACGSASSNSMNVSATAASGPRDPVVKEEMGYDSSFAEDGFDTDGGSLLEDQKIIYTGRLELETTDFDTAAKAIGDLAASLGGYLESSTVGGSGRDYRWADYTVRIPAQRFHDLLNRAGDIANVTWQNTEMQNVTETYYDTEGRLKTQQIKLERLQKLLAQAGDMEDIITIESAISEAEWAIEDLSGTLQHYDALVDLATVEISLQEVYKYSNTEELPQNFGDRVGNALGRGWVSFTDGIEDFVVFLAYSWMWLLLWAAVIVLAVILVRRSLRRRRAAKTQKISQDVPPTGDKSDQT